jgi:hypothetical protein
MNLIQMKLMKVIHNLKQFDPRISTFFGINIDSIDEDENADDPIRVNCEFDSNEIDETDSQSKRLFGTAI